MSSVARKRLCEDSLLASTGRSSSGSAKKQMVQRKAVGKWIKELDKAYNTAVWLKFEVVDREYVSLLNAPSALNLVRS